MDSIVFWTWADSLIVFVDSLYERNLKCKHNVLFFFILQEVYQNKYTVYFKKKQFPSFSAYLLISGHKLLDAVCEDCYKLHVKLRSLWMAEYADPQHQHAGCVSDSNLSVLLNQSINLVNIVHLWKWSDGPSSLY
jgi:hypothetical protein